MGTITKHFSYREFEMSATADRLDICNVVVDVRVRNAIRALVLNVLEPLRLELGMPVHVSSGYRCPELNREVGGTPDSQHVRGEAADIYVVQKDGTRLPSVDVARQIVASKLPYDQLILYPTFVHLSHKLSGAQRHRILYNKSYKGPEV